MIRHTCLSLLGLTTLLAAPAYAAPRVLTDIPAVHSLAAQVMEGVAAPELLLDRGASPHHFQLRPSQASALAQADLVIWIGPALTPWLDRGLANLSDPSRAMRLDSVAGLYTQDFGAGPHSHEGHDHGDHGPMDDHSHDHDDASAPAPEAGHDHDHAEADHDHAEADNDHAEAGHDHAEADHDHGEEGHVHTGLDPHLWLDPVNAQLWLGAIRERLSTLDPANAVAYAANAEKASAALGALDAEVATRLAPVKGQEFAVFHDAYGYFTGHYGLQPAHAVALGDATAPGAERLAALRAEMVADKIVCAFLEAQHDPRQVAQLVEGTSVRLGPALDPSGSSLEPGTALYGSLLRGLAEGLATCLTPKG